MFLCIVKIAFLLLVLYLDYSFLTCFFLRKINTRYFCCFKNFLLLL